MLKYLDKKNRLKIVSMLELYHELNETTNFISKLPLIM